MTSHAFNRHPHRATRETGGLHHYGLLVWRVLFLAVGVAALLLFALFVGMVIIEVITTGV